MYNLEDCPACRDGMGLMMNEGGWCAYVECSDCGAHTAHFAYDNEEERLEAEKERIRAEKRAANPDGITENTSKKKLQKQQRDLEAAAKAAAAKEYAAKKGIVEEEEETVMSGIPSRPYCKGRNYDPNRYASTEE